MKIQGGEELSQVSQGISREGSFNACAFVHSCLCARSEHTHEAAVGQEAKKLCYDTVPVC